MSERNPYAPPTAPVADVAVGNSVSTSGEDTEAPFFAVSVFKFALMTVFTLGFYQLFWFYKNWQIIKARENSTIRPAARALFAVFFCYECFSRVRDYEHPELPQGRLLAGPLAAGWIILTVLGRLQGPYWLASELAFLFIIPVQRRINHINHTVAPSHDPNGRLTWLNWIAAVVGGVTLVFALVGTFFPDAS
jgi:hypothetical protein